MVTLHVFNKNVRCKPRCCAHNNAPLCAHEVLRRAQKPLRHTPNANALSCDAQAHYAFKQNALARVFCHTLLMLVLGLCVLGLAPLLFTPPTAFADTSIETVTSDAAYEDSTTAANMVLLVSFADTEQSVLDGFNGTYPYGNTLSTNWHYLMWSIDGIGQTLIPRTWRNYLYDVSRGQCNVKSYFPQTQEDRTAMHITLSHPASYYKGNDALLVSDITAKFNELFPTYDASKLDQNNDGYIDSLMLIATTSDVFTSHKASVGGNAYKFGANNTTSTQRTVGDSVFLVEATSYSAFTGQTGSIAAHEFLHTLGARDYYRKQNNPADTSGTSLGEPVECWGIMAKGGGFSWPLAYTREQVGWETIPEVNISTLNTTNPVTYTLYSPAESDAGKDVAHPDKPQAIKLTTNLSSSEYFIVEYRTKNTETLAYDKYIGASGLIVYRVNEAYKDEGNLYGNDYVYVFRPGITSITASDGDIQRAAITAQAYANQTNPALAQSIGSTDLAAPYTDNTIFFSDGENSGIQIDITDQTSNSISFTLSTADYSDAWNDVSSVDASSSSETSASNSPFGTWSSPSVETTTDGTNPYLLIASPSHSNPQTAVWKHNGSNWTQIGSTLTDITDAHMAYYNNKPYVLGIAKNNSNQLVLKVYTNNQWQTAASTTMEEPIASQAIDMRVIANTLYMFVAAQGNQTYNRIYYLDANGSGLVQYGPDISIENVAVATLANCGNRPVVIASDIGPNPWQTNMYQLNNNAWSTTKLGSGGSSTIEAVTKDNTTYVYTFSSDSKAENPAQIWVLATTSDSENNITTSIEKTINVSALRDATQSSSICMGTSNLYLVKNSGQREAHAYSISLANLATTTNNSNASLTKLGETILLNATSLDSVAIGDTLYCALGDTNTGSVVVKKHKLQSSDTAAELDPIQETPPPSSSTSTSSGASGPSDTGSSSAGSSASSSAGQSSSGGSTSSSTSPSQKTLPKPEAIKAQTYTGASIIPKPIIKQGSTVLKEGVDYKLAYTNNVNPGTATITVTGINNYMGTQKVNFTIEPRPISSIAITTSHMTKNATGKALQPSVSVKHGSTTLKKGSDYTLTYNGSTTAPSKAGSYKLKIKGTGKYTGEKDLGTFTLVKGPGVSANTKVYLACASNTTCVLDAAGSTPKKGANVSIHSDTTGKNQKWYLKLGSDGYYTIQSSSNKTYVVSASGSTPKSGANVSVTTGSSYNQKWILEPMSGGAYRIKNAANPKLALTISSSSIKSGTNVVVNTANSSNAQRWKVVSSTTKLGFSSTKTYRITNAANTKYSMKASGSKAKKSANISVTSKSSSKTQKWYLVSDKNGYYTIKSASNKKYVAEAKGSKVKKGANVRLYTNKNTKNQKWKIEQRANGTYIIKNAYNQNLVLSASGSKPKKGANVSVQKLSGATNQTWKISRA